MSSPNGESLEFCTEVGCGDSVTIFGANIDTFLDIMGLKGQEPSIRKWHQSHNFTEWLIHVAIS